MDIESFAKENHAMILRYFVALTEQRTLDMARYGANCYAPVTIDHAKEQLYKLYLHLVNPL